MKLSIPATALVVVACPLVASAYSIGGPRRFRGPMVVMPPAFSSSSCSPERFRQRQRALANRAFGIYSPRYEITDNDELFQIAVDVPGVKAEDIDVSIENDGQTLSLSGRREAMTSSAVGTGRYEYSSKFAQSFSLDPAIDVDKFTANLQNGVLIVSAPKDFQRIEERIKKIPVMQVDAESVEKPTEARDEMDEKDDSMEVLEEEVTEDTEKESKDDSEQEKQDPTDSAPAA